MTPAPKANIAAPDSGLLSDVAAPASFGISILVSIIGALFGGIFGGSSVDAVNSAVQALRQAMNQGFDEAARFTWAVGNGLGSLVQAFATTWDDFFDAIWNALKAIWKAVWCALATVLPKLIQLAKDARNFLDTIYQKYIRPALLYLQLIRRYLQILKLFHIGFATKLDNILGQIQNAIMLPFLYIFRTLTGYGRWINLILAADLTIQRAVFVRTMYKYQADWINMWWTGQQVQGTPGSGPPTATGQAAPSSKQVASDFTAYSTSDTGPYATTASDTQSAFDAIMAA